MNFHEYKNTMKNYLSKLLESVNNLKEQIYSTGASRSCGLNNCSTRMKDFIFIGLVDWRKCAKIY